MKRRMKNTKKKTMLTLIYKKKEEVINLPYTVASVVV